MLTLLTGSYCDVCAEEYGPQLPPHCIPCGHVLCASCCNTIVEKSTQRQPPACPFCREHFTTDDIRLIRTDFTSSAWSTPRRRPVPLETINKNDSAAAHWAKREERLLLAEGGCSRVREEARRLEDKVAKVAAKKCSVEEVSTLHQELEEWLQSAVKEADQTPSLSLSAALLRAILMNHVVHSEATKHAKSLEATLKGKLDDMEIANGKLEAELRRQRLQYSQKAQECQTLRTELNRLKVLATTVGPVTSASASASAQQRPMSPPPTSATPSPLSPYGSSTTSTPSRYNTLHARSTSMHVSSRPSTPAHSVRSHTPSLRSHTPAPVRFSTPAPPSTARSHTPAPPPPEIPPKPRRLSTPSPPTPKMARSLSDERQAVHERWIPPSSPESGPPPSRLSRLIPSRSASVAARSRNVRSPSPA